MLEFADRFAILVLALAIEAAIAYPDALSRAIGHPVGWLGAAVRALDDRLNRAEDSFTVRRAWGVVALVILLAVAVGVGKAIEVVTAGLGMLGFAVRVVVAASLIAAGSLDRHVATVARALGEAGLAAGRAALARIGGGDAPSLDESGVCRAAIERLAESASGAVFAPAFWFVVGGLPGMIAYQAIHTAAAEIGHRTDRHLAFGWAAARLDDLVNLPASRLTAALFVGAAGTLPDASTHRAVEVIFRDAGKHRSPNAGWPQASLAGALGLRLGGPHVEDGVLVDGAFLGGGLAAATQADILRALTIYRIAVTGSAVLAALVFIALV